VFLTTLSLIDLDVFLFSNSKLEEMIYGKTE